MQTYLPFRDYEESARSLDTNTLRVQRTDALTLLRHLVIGVGTPALAGHPAVAAWRGCERDLIKYIFAMCNEWTFRGHSDEVSKLASRLFHKCEAGPPPAWVDVKALHENHRGLLLMKDPEFYIEKFDCKPATAELWPITKFGAWVYTYNGGKVGAMKFEGDFYSLGAGPWQRCSYCRYLSDVEEIGAGGMCEVCLSKGVSRLRRVRLNATPDEVSEIDAALGELIRAIRSGMVRAEPAAGLSLQEEVEIEEVQIYSK